MTPDQATAKVKEIVKEYLKWKGLYGFAKDVEDQFIYFLTTPAAQTLIDSLAGEDWISVEDRLPQVEEGEADEVIMNSHVKNPKHTSDIVLCGVFYNGRFYVATEWDGGDPDKITPIEEGRITHWMPIPEPPKTIL